MTRPDFLVIGAMKCATSSLCGYLERHPDVFMVRRAEPNFFSHDANWARGPEWYAQFFAGRGTQALCGEGSNEYTMEALHPRSAERMRAFCPEVKLIYLVRDPVERIVASWIQKRTDQRDAIPPTLDRAVAEMPDHFINESLYWRQIGRYRDHFPDEQILIGFMEDLMADRAAFMARIGTFLGIAPEAGEIRHANPSSAKRVPSPLYSAVRRMPGVKSAVRLFPNKPKVWLRRTLFSTPASNRPQFSPDTLARLEAMLAEDSAALLRHCGKPADFWPVAAQASAAPAAPDARAV
jgi:hypothetical protein